MKIDRREFSASALGLALVGCASRPASPSTTGTVWRELAIEPYAGKQDDVSFVSLNEGWYGNGAGKLYHTADGGETWTKVWDQPGTFIRALGFIDAQNGFLGNVGVGYYPNVTDPSPLYRTRDGGSTWTPVEAEGIGLVEGVCGIDVLHQRRIFQGALRQTEIVHAAGRVGGPAALLRSLDSGATWRVIDLSAHAGMILDVKFFSADVGFVCAASSTSIEEANALMLRTLDGGQSWTPVYRSPRRFENCWKMSFPSRQIGYATVQNYEEGATQRIVIKTTDGGATWREMPLVDDARVREFGVGFVTENWGWVGASTTGYETRNGGRSWEPVTMGRAVNKIRVVRDGSRWRAYAIGVGLSRLDGA
ncbi:MAG: WD40/YVTN/BNR-like repeat-containing protein [Alphaproteobacteria bacterium]|jgi:photosystem II stability/assembly factor-like uncharacterized protein